MANNVYTEKELTRHETQKIIGEALSSENWEGKRVLLILPDSTRSAPVDVIYKGIHEKIQDKAACLDCLIALGTHQPMSMDSIFLRVGITREEYRQKYSQKTSFYNHSWNNLDALIKIGMISACEVKRITNGLMDRDVEISINRLIFNYDVIMVIGPVYPHEIVGFSGGNKYFFPGICGEEILNMFHWLGSLITNAVINGTKDTPVRKIIDLAAGFIKKPLLYFNMVVNHGRLYGLFVGNSIEAWGRACDLSAKINIEYTGRRFKKVLGIASSKYDEIWTAGKVAYKAETIVEDDGELIIFAPHITEISLTHGKYIDKTGYHVRDYFATRMEKFRDIPGCVISHITAVKGAGSFDNGKEKPRINVTLATGIPEKKCKEINLGYSDPSGINMEEWENREDEGIFVIYDAGDVLYKVN